MCTGNQTPSNDSERSSRSCLQWAQESPRVTTVYLSALASGVQVQDIGACQQNSHGLWTKYLTHIIWRKDVANHPALLRWCCRASRGVRWFAIGWLPAGHQNYNVPNICDVWNHLQSMVHHGLLETREKSVTSEKTALTEDKMDCQVCLLSNLCVSTQYFDSLWGNEQIYLRHRLRLSFRCLDIINAHICCISHVNSQTRFLEFLKKVRDAVVCVKPQWKVVVGGSLLIQVKLPLIYSIGKKRKKKKNNQ